jgi:uncharacterized protein (DUF2132 family)
MSSKGPIDPQSAVDFLIKTAPAYAKAKAERVYLEEFRKSKKAILMQQSSEKTAAMQERDAYAHPEYLGLLAALRVAVDAEENARWLMVAAQTRVEVWRSQNAANRQIERVTA